MKRHSILLQATSSHADYSRKYELQRQRNLYPSSLVHVWDEQIQKYDLYLCRPSERTSERARCLFRVANPSSSNLYLRGTLECMHRVSCWLLAVTTQTEFLKSANFNEPLSNMRSGYHYIPRQTCKHRFCLLVSCCLISILGIWTSLHMCLILILVDSEKYLFHFPFR